MLFRSRKKIGKGEGNLEAWVQSKITKAADYIDTAADYVDSGEMKEETSNNHKKPFDVAVAKIMKRSQKKKMTSRERIIALKQAGKYQEVNEQQVGGSVKIKPGSGLGGGVLSYPEGKAPQKHGDKEPKLPKLQQAHYEPEGEMIDEKCWSGYKKKGMKTMFGKKYPNCVKAEEYEYSNWRADFGLSEDWQKANRNDGVDGLSQSTVNVYKREHPGSKLQTAVTEKNPKGKRKKRRASYCRRSAGQRDMHNIDCSKTPDKPICKARKRWKC